MVQCQAHSRHAARVEVLPCSHFRSHWTLVMGVRLGLLLLQGNSPPQLVPPLPPLSSAPTTPPRSPCSSGC